MKQLITPKKGIHHNPPTAKQVRLVKQILNWGPLVKFARCPGKPRGFIRKREALGDYSHSARRHLCDVCQCKNRAGQGTKGDYYGLGVETGHLGVGLCFSCGKGVPAAVRLKMAEQDMVAFQTVGPITDRVKRIEQLEQASAEEAKLVMGVREDMMLVRRTLNEFKQLAEDGELTEKYKDGPGTASDVTRIKLALDIATTISKLSLDHFKLDSASYIHYDEFKLRMPQYLSLVKRCLMKLKELSASWKEGDTEPIEVVYNDFVIGHKQIWENVKTGAKT